MPALSIVVAGALLLTACEAGPRGPVARRITIPDLTGLSRTHAIDLIADLALEISVERVESERLARAVVLSQDPPPGTVVDPGSTITLFVPARRPLGERERRFRLLTHCGLSFPLEFAGRFWLPVDPQLRRTLNPPEGFASDGFFDKGTIRRIDRDTLVYTSSTGTSVEYEPTDRGPGGCD
jgi:hypothetical protein